MPPTRAPAGRPVLPPQGPTANDPAMSSSWKKMSSGLEVEGVFVLPRQLPQDEVPFPPFRRRGTAANLPRGIFARLLLLAARRRRSAAAPPPSPPSTG